MPRVRIDDLDPIARDLGMKEMKSLFGGLAASMLPGSGSSTDAFDAYLRSNTGLLNKHMDMADNNLLLKNSLPK